MFAILKSDADVKTENKLSTDGNNNKKKLKNCVSWWAGREREGLCVPVVEGR